MNDSLSTESSAQPRWLWQRGGWLLVDRNTGRITQIELPGFRYYSDVSWYRDDAAYRAVADDGERVSAIVAQITTKKPIYKKQVEKLGGELPRRGLRASLVATQADSGDIYGADVTPDTPGEE